MCRIPQLHLNVKLMKISNEIKSLGISAERAGRPRFQRTYSGRAGGRIFPDFLRKVSASSARRNSPSSNVGCSMFVGGRCLNQDLQDLGIFGIAGDRSVLVRRFVFAEVERAVGRGGLREKHARKENAPQPKLGGVSVSFQQTSRGLRLAIGLLRRSCRRHIVDQSPTPLLSLVAALTARTR